MAAVLSLILLNASLTYVNVWPTPAIAWSNAFSLELAVSLMLLAVAHRRAPALARRVLPALWIALVAGHYLDVTAPGLYGREFNIYWDSQHLGAVGAMFARVAPWWLIAAASLGALLALVLAYVIARIAIGHVAAAMGHRRARVALSVAGGALVAIFFAQSITTQAVIPFADPVTPAYVRQARYAFGMLGSRAAPSFDAGPNLAGGLQALGGVDVVLVFIESYGAVTYETPAIADGLAESRATLDAAVRQTGRQVVSAFVDAPTFGGSSWLSHLTLLSGIEVRDQYAYTALMASDRDTMVTAFSRSEYRTVALMPGMRQAWPEGAFYGFDVIYGRDALRYEGPQFGWWGIPDQYSLARLDDLERGGLRVDAAGALPRRRPPVFVTFPTSTSHAPFGPVPPYQPVWPRIMTRDAFDQPVLDAALSRTPDLTDMRPSYVRAIAYELTTLAGYLRAQQDDVLLILVGDHQPPAAVSGPGAPWHVPVHVIGRQPPVLDALRDRGFRSGLHPGRPPVGEMHQLTSMLLEAFDAPPPADYLNAENGSRVPPITSASNPPSTGGP